MIHPLARSARIRAPCVAHCAGLQALRSVFEVAQQGFMPSLIFTQTVSSLVGRCSAKRAM
eukprot:COSAG03_NODE_2132_length_3091_cov_29.773396_3_plen_60_part_00